MLFTTGENLKKMWKKYVAFLIIMICHFLSEVYMLTISKQEMKVLRLPGSTGRDQYWVKASTQQPSLEQRRSPSWLCAVRRETFLLTGKASHVIKLSHINYSHSVNNRRNTGISQTRVPNTL